MKIKQLMVLLAVNALVLGVLWANAFTPGRPTDLYGPGSRRFLALFGSVIVGVALAVGVFSYLRGRSGARRRGAQDHRTSGRPDP